ncbi:MAG TPA: ATP-dependent DNA helicase, partial [Gemmatimonadaceae bacterium]|nr:ATP-dependent DNA helicase [Gemmatimonadaceae bacterium]
MIAFPEAVADSAQLDPVAIANDLGPDGPIAAAMQQYEDRPAQREMASSIAELYNDGGVGLIEAGTGVGKSLGYLLPALRWAHLTGERTVVSTNTINLQEQLVRKDLPFLEKALAAEQPVRFALLKGWRNYLCLLRLEQARVMGPALFDDASSGIDLIATWAKTTEDGSISDLGFAPSPDVWDEVAAEPDLCTRTKCPHFDKCFFFRARKDAAQAQVVVANHHLLMSDVAVRRMQQNWEEAAVIPAYSRLVIDEGHHL